MSLGANVREPLALPTLTTWTVVPAVWAGGVVRSLSMYAEDGLVGEGAYPRRRQRSWRLKQRW